MTTKVRVRVSFEVDVEVPEEWDDDMIHFDIEENHCPGTGRVGSAIEEMIVAEHEDPEPGGACWACPEGKNEIVSITRSK